MSTPVHEIPQPSFESHRLNVTPQTTQDDGRTIGGDTTGSARNDLTQITTEDFPRYDQSSFSPSQSRAQEHRLDDDLALLQAERIVSKAQQIKSGSKLYQSESISRSRSRRPDPVDEFDANTNPLHEKTAMFQPPEHPSTKFAKAFKKIHESSYIIRYFTYIIPVVIILLIPLMLGAFVFKKANVGGVSLLWFSIWLEIFWLTLWAGRVRPTLG